MPDETIEQARLRRDRLVPDAQLHIDTDAFTENEAVLRPVTLFVGSMIITGKPVTYQTWFSRLAAQNEDGEPMTVGAHVAQEVLDELVAKLWEVTARGTDPEYEFTDGEKLTLTSTFSTSIYLTEARVLSGGGDFIPSAGATVDMKVRYAAVDAWCYGLMAPSA